MTAYSLGLSPCPNDTFIFHALLHDKVSRPNVQIEPYIADVEALNTKVREGALDFSKISIGVYAHIAERYAILSAGSALGFGCGPLVVTRKGARPREDGSVAIPGKMTTANFLLDLCQEFPGERKEMLFSDIIPAVERGEVEYGVIIHEGRFTYANHGLLCALDLGQWWEERYGVPLPLGVIVVRRDISSDLAEVVDQAIARSLQFAWDNPDASRAYIKSHAQELEDSVIASHIATFVTKFSYDLGSEGRKAVSILVTEQLRVLGKTVAQPIFRADAS